MPVARNEMEKNGGRCSESDVALQYLKGTIALLLHSQFTLIFAFPTNLHSTDSDDVIPWLLKP